ncbi:hypothetical protein U9J35_03820 [Rossellomorea aquimaris]|nr:hypothetical protein [Rossellomorea aquimaris]WRP07305.1 hypothetical protein U9J35_03820 [Rossellomorea aquimaris]
MHRFSLSHGLHVLDEADETGDMQLPERINKPWSIGDIVTLLVFRILMVLLIFIIESIIYYKKKLNAIPQRVMAFSLLLRSHLAFFLTKVNHILKKSQWTCPPGFPCAIVS